MNDLRWLGETLLLAFLTLFAGCKCSPPSILTSVPSPSGKQVLTYTMDTFTRPNGSAIFGVNIDSNGTQSVRVFETNNSNHHLKTKWLSEQEVLVDCGECSLSSSDVHFFRMKSNNVTIKYIGVPLDERHRK
jgi:hypothetical protein